MDLSKLNDIQKQHEQWKRNAQIVQARRVGGAQNVVAELGKTPWDAMNDVNKRGADLYYKTAYGNLSGAFRNMFIMEHWRAGQLIGVHNPFNDITNEGLLALLSVMFNAGTQITIWYLLLVDNAGFTAFADGDTYANINQAGNGWDEFSSYTDANNAASAVTRPVWPEDAPSANSITNSTTKAIYDMTAGGTLKGIGVVGGGTSPQNKDDNTAGSTLWATAPFSGGNITVANTDQLKLTYTINASHP